MGIKQTEGAVIAKVEPRSSADRAGLRSGDLVVAVDGVPVRSATQLRNRIGLTRVGETVELRVDRKGDQHVVRAQIDQAEAPPERRDRRQH
jgi:S1-C subfamily serine protease